MNKEIPHDLIEQYLAGNLSKKEQQAVEQRLSTDADFRAEVTLQRAIQLHLGNPAEVHLRSSLEKMWKDFDTGLPHSDIKPKPILSLWRPYLAIAATIALVLAAWWWFKPSPTAIEPNIAEQPTTPTLPEKQAPRRDETQQTPTNQSPAKRPMAMANPADFTPNPALEARIGNIRGDGDISIDLSSPVPASEFQLKDGQITMTVRATVNADDIPADQPVRLLVYSNRLEDLEKKQPLFDLGFPMQQNEAGKYLVHYKQQLPLKPGLYYFQIGQRRSQADDGGYRTIWVGKFTVEAKNK